MDGELTGGNMNTVHRVGDTVLRLAGPWTPTVHRYLSHLEDAGIDGIPRPIGIAGDRETLTFVDGEVPEYPLPAWVWTDAALAEAAHRLRELHDASVGFETEGAIWQSPSHEPAEVICHNDFAPHNLAFRGGRVIGVIDFDMCSPGPRVWDLAYLATRMVPLTTERHDGAPSQKQSGRRIRLLLDAYGTEINPEDVLRVVVVRLRELAAFTRATANELGKPELLDDAALYDRDAAHFDAVVGDVAGN